MKLTNKLGLPDALVKAVAANDYVRGDVKPVEGWPGYHVTVYGDIISTRRGRPRVLSLNDRRGYRGIALCDGRGGSRRFNVHRLVAFAFIPNPHGYPCINHIDNDKTNNRADNLEWCTYKQNTAHGIKQGRIHWNNPHSKLTRKQVSQVRKLLAAGMSQDSIGNKFGVCQGTISHIKLGKTWIGK